MVHDGTILNLLLNLLEGMVLWAVVLLFYEWSIFATFMMLIFVVMISGLLHVDSILAGLYTQRNETMIFSMIRLSASAIMIFLTIRFSIVFIGDLSSGNIGFLLPDVIIMGGLLTVTIVMTYDFLHYLRK